MILSICIPSYNRFEHLKLLVKSILKAQSKNFDVIIVDNGSDSDIYEELNINDERVRIIKRDIIVKGPTNNRLALNYADGKYAMLCLDKDFIIGENLDIFINKLSHLKGISCGYCELNSQRNSSEFVCSNNIVENIYRCGHPSGMFIRNIGLKEESMELDLMNEQSLYYNNAFLGDLLYAKCLCLGKQAVYQGKLINTESLEQAAKTKSYSYSRSDDNIYFFPKNRKKQFWIFIQHLNGLNIQVQLMSNIISKLISKTLYDVSLGYKQTMQIEEICEHYGIESKMINRKEVLKELNAFSREVRNSNIKNISNKKVKRTLILNKAKIQLRILINV